jgi:diguanylate cyclase (GGDEF)-like protein/PAS domain S-box-containing protein
MKTILSALIFALLLSVSVAFATPQQAVAPLEKVSLQLKWLHQFQFAGYYAAKEQGYYAAEGLDVDIFERSLDKDFIKQVLSGDKDFGIGDSGILAYYARGEPIVALAAIFQHNPLVFIAKQSSGIISPYEMKGKRIMFDSKGMDDSVLQAVLAEAHLTEKNYTIVKQSFRNDDLIENKIDVMSGYLSDAIFYFQQKNIKVNVINPQNYGIDFYGDLLFTSQNELTQHPGRAEKFRRASLKGWQYALDHPEELIRLISKKYHCRLPLEHLRFEADVTRKLILPDVIPLGHIDAGRMRKVAEVYAQLNLSPPLPEKKLAHFINPFFNRGDDKPLIVGSEQDFPPFALGKTDATAGGFTVELWRAVAEEAHLNSVIRVLPWNQVLEEFKAGNSDVLINFAPSDERRQFADFTVPHVTANEALFVRDNENSIHSEADLINKQFVIVKGDFALEYLQEKDWSKQITSVDTAEEGLQLLANGQHDAMLMSKIVGKQILDKLNIGNIKTLPIDLGLSLKFSFAVHKGDAELLAKINEALAIMKANGTYDKLYEKWFGVYEEKELLPLVIKYLAPIVSVFLSILVVIFHLRNVERKQAGQYEKFRSYTLELLAGDNSLAYILEAIVRGVEQLKPKMQCSILLLDDEGKHLIQGAAPSLPDFYNAAINGIEIGIGVGSCGTAAFTGELVIVEDITTHPFWTPYKELAAKAGLGACWSQPILSSSGAVLGTFSIYHNKANKPKNSDIELIQQSARLASLSIERKRLEERLRILSVAVEQSPTSIVITNSEGNLIYVNPRFTKVTGYRFEEAMGKNPRILQSGMTAREIYKQLWKQLTNGQLWLGEFINQRKNGEIYTEEVHIAPVKDLSGVTTHYVGVKLEITERKKIEAELRIAAIAFEAQEGILVTDAKQCIIRVNKAFTEITGYTTEEVLGKNPNLLQSGRHDALFYTALWDSIRNTGAWAGEIWNRRKNGDIYPEYMTITAVKDSDGKVTNYVATFNDITLSRAAADEIEQLAFYDPLTRLPNRRLLNDRLTMLLSESKRHHTYSALMFLDLDNFKPLNDQYGHEVGDMLLIEAAQRLKSCVREIDTVARFGGDEFVVMLSGLDTDKEIATSEAKVIAEKIGETLSKIYTFTINQNAIEHRCTASIGVVIFNGEQMNKEEIMKLADSAMYKAKEAGRNQVQIV